ncbi:ArnT family glycosyltransferase [Deminuibacter soli]|uniref:Phospholipid carrier-dependent glycosyltransferase n=1 Tax=Deminuibacter soli TaxID=2291815 RepID=A0A3E1ND62_9BACT|nr:glycosyltransferase family 39 protein [Deminuibacter soli]RFM25802.1 phospholipid carrier-dependent glycosyltransferase [Deminuibacter soli]
MYKKSLIWLIVLATLGRCIVASAVELGNDEVYYWTYSQHLQWNYFDHPPMIAFMIKLFTGNLLFQYSELFVRLGSIVCGGLATWFIYKLVTRISSEKAGFTAAVLYTTSLYSSIIAGVFAMPDSPQMLWWVLSIYMIAILTTSEQTKGWQWLLLGTFTGLCIMSKIHGVFICFGFALYVIFYKREWLRNPWLYISFVVCFAIALPIFFWNYDNNFITYQFHSQRVGTHHLQFQSDSFLREIVGEIMYNNPINFVLTAIAVTLFLKRKPQHASPFMKASLLIALPMIGVLIGMSMFNDTLPHWSGPAYVTLIPLVAIHFSPRCAPERTMPRSAGYAMGLLMVTLVGAILLVNHFPGTLSNKKTAINAGSGDFTLDMYGWDQTAKQMALIEQRDVAAGKMAPGSVFISNKWFPAAHTDYYIARPLGMKVIGMGNMFDLHHYVWMNTYAMQQEGSQLRDAYCIVPSNYNSDVRGLYSGEFAHIDSVGTYPVLRGGKVCRYFSVYRLKNFHGTVPEIQTQ